MKKPFAVGDKSFPSKKDATAFVRRILYSSPVGYQVATEHQAFLTSLLMGHPDAAEKTGAGVHHFTVEKSDYGTVCFYVNRVDGTKTDFSFISCLGNKSRDLRKDEEESTCIPPIEQVAIDALYERARRATLETGVQHDVDHIQPISKGGRHRLVNLWIVSHKFNLEKGTSEMFS